MKNLQLNFREMFINEVLEVSKLHNELAYFIQRETQDEYWDFEILSEDNISKHIQSFVDNAERKIYIAKDNDKILGFIACEIIQCHLPISSVNKVGYISGAFVLPEYRGKGILRSLEALVTEYFKACGLRFVELNFISNNILAKKSWEGLGYKTFREQARKTI